MKIFADFHHDDLYHSLHLTLEKRLGHVLYHPIGPEWYTKGYWKYSREPRVIHQYLSSGKTWEDKGDHCLVDNPCHDRKLRAVTFDQFKEMKFDVILGSVPEHVYLYDKLRKEYQPQAKQILQMGNEWKDLDLGPVKNLMVSCAPFDLPDRLNVVFYHQEFDLDLFKFVPGNVKNPIQSFVNDLPNLKDWGLFQRFEKSLPEWEWKSYGLGCRDGNIRPLTKLVDMMQASSFICHFKSLGDGFGHIIHNAFALGRPVIVRSKWYKKRAAEPLLLDGITCIDVDKHTFKDACDLIKFYGQEGKYERMCERAKAQFDKVVNYDKEADEIRVFLENLL